MTTPRYPATNEQIIALLREHDIIPTVQRVQIASLLLSRPQHLSADQLLQLALANGANVSKATVYNTLNLFAGKGLVRGVNVDNEKLFFDSNTSVHSHFYNEDSGELIDFADDTMEISSMPELPDNTVATGLDVVIRLKNKS